EHTRSGGGSVGIFDGERMRGRHALNDWHALNDMYQRRPFLETSERVKFLAAYDLLSKHLTREVAELASDLASQRVEYLQIAEPPPHREDFLPAKPPPPSQISKVLAQVEQEFERAWH